MKKYDNYKDSGIEWIGEIPMHWNLKKIKHTTYVKGRIGWKGLRSDEFLELSDSYVVTGTDFENGKIKWKTCYQVPLDRYEDDPFIKLKNDDLLITKDGTIGKIALVKEMPKIATLNSGVFLTRPYKDEYSQEFMYWMLFSEVFKTFYDYNKSGSTIQHLYQNVFNEFEYALPPMSEQIQICNYLDHKTKQIDNLITKKEQFITLLQEECTAVINQAVTKGLDPKVQLKDSGIEWLGEIPEHWAVKKIKYLGKILNGYSFKSDDFIEKDGCRVMKIANIQTMNIDWSDESFVPHSFYEKYSNFQIKKGDLVFALTRPIISTGIKASIVDFDEKILLNQRNAVLKTTNKLNVNWMYYLVFNPRFINHFESLIDKTGQQPNISSSDISNIPIPLPSKEEQQSIIDYISFEEKKINNIIFITQKEIELLKEYKTALINEVITGKVDVRYKEINLL